MLWNSPQNCRKHVVILRFEEMVESCVRCLEKRGKIDTPVLRYVSDSLNIHFLRNSASTAFHIWRCFKKLLRLNMLTLCHSWIPHITSHGRLRCAIEGLIIFCELWKPGRQIIYHGYRRRRNPELLGRWPMRRARRASSLHVQRVLPGVGSQERCRFCSKGILDQTPRKERNEGRDDHHLLLLRQIDSIFKIWETWVWRHPLEANK